MTMTTCNAPAQNLPRQRPSMFAMLSRIIATQGQRRALRALDATALNDLGLSNADAEREAGRPFWDVPATWRR